MKTRGFLIILAIFVIVFSVTTFIISGVQGSLKRRDLHPGAAFRGQHSRELNAKDALIVTKQGSQEGDVTESEDNRVEVRLSSSALPPLAGIEGYQQRIVEKAITDVISNSIIPVNAKDILIGGWRLLVNRDGGAYKRQLQKRGYSVKIPSFSLRGYTDAVRVLDPAVALYVCLDTSDGDRSCIPSERLAFLAPYQRVNRIHGVRHTFWRKDGFCTLSSKVLGAWPEAGFMLPCWTVPTQTNEFLHHARQNSQQSWILKPPLGAEGLGIRVFDSADDLLRTVRLGAPAVVQPYMKNPYLINGYKIDLRTYVLVSRLSPLIAYFYTEGLVRFASSKYVKDSHDGGSRHQFLTNTFANAGGKDKRTVDDLTWTFRRFRNHLESQGHNASDVFEKMHAAVRGTLLAGESQYLKFIEKLEPRLDPSQGFQLLGVDVMFDEQLEPVVIEVNGNPSMKLSGAKASDYDSTKSSLLSDILSVVLNNREETQTMQAVATAYIREDIDLRATGCRQPSSSRTPCLSDVELSYLHQLAAEAGSGGVVDSPLEHGFYRIFPTIFETKECTEVPRITRACEKFPKRLCSRKAADLSRIVRL